MVIYDYEPGEFLLDRTNGRSLPHPLPVLADGSRVITGVVTGQLASAEAFSRSPSAFPHRGLRVFRDGADACIHESVTAQL